MRTLFLLMLLILQQDFLNEILSLLKRIALCEYMSFRASPSDFNHSEALYDVE